MLLPLGNVIEKLTAGLDVGHQLGMLRIKLPLDTKIVHAVHKQGAIVKLGGDDHLCIGVDHGHPQGLLVLPYQIHIFASGHGIILLKS